MQRLSLDTCPACETENPAAAQLCVHCGSPLVQRCPACEAINVRSRVACHHCGARLIEWPEAEVPDADEPVVPVLLEEGESAPPDNDWMLSLRFDTLTPPLPVLDTTPPPPEQPAADRDAQNARSAPTPAVDPSAQLRDAKAERRASVRRARLGGQPAPAATTTARDVLLLEPDKASRIAVAQLLTAFGFRPHLATSVGEAEGLSLRLQHVAVFLGLGTDVDGTANLCRRLRDLARTSPLVIVAMDEPNRHTNRVRMQLAGADTMLFRPIGRGDLARALDAGGLALPTDPRRGAAPAE